MSLSSQGSLRILLIGAGGREHALAWKLEQSPLVDHIYVVPGNGGTASRKITTVPLPAESYESIVEFAIKNEVNLVVPGPEQPLVDGIEGIFRKVGIPVFGPSAQAARMEGSKAFSKDFMTRHGIPTASFKTFTSNQIKEAHDYVKSCGHRVVLKASGLAGGKGVLIPESTEEALKGLNEIMIDGVFGSAGNEVVVEEYLEGPELSILAFSDGYTIVPLPAAQDHKRIGEGDTGLNTGGMGAYAPAPVATPDVTARIMRETLQPTITGMRKDGFPFVGLLFTGFMITSSGPKVLEYNVRFGDPETEALVLLLSEEADLAAIMLACVERRLDSISIPIRSGFAVAVVLASAGYPGSYEKGKVVEIGSMPEGVVPFHAGTSISDGKVVTSGGRVIALAAHAPTLQGALDLAYQGIDTIAFEGKTYRRDIAHRALKPNRGDIESLTYAAAGVSVDKGNNLVDAIKPFVKDTRRPGADGEIGGFGGVFDLKALDYQDPVLVSGTDGVGTKLLVAMDAGVHSTVGIDLVAMSVNDLIVQGAEPLYFLDYYGCSSLNVEVATQVIKGIAEGCKEAGCALVGGETAEMPGMYKGDEYDLAGFAVGIVERSLLLPQPSIKPNDVLLGIPSSGVHSNGFSLVRKILERSGLGYDSVAPWDPKFTISQELLKPTRIYVKSLLPAVKRGLIKGMAHITGGGFIENIPRALPQGLGCFVDLSAWELPDVFKWLMKEGKVEAKEMARTFNNGVGMVLIVNEEDQEEVLKLLNDAGEKTVYTIGRVAAIPGVELRDTTTW